MRNALWFIVHQACMVIVTIGVAVGVAVVFVVASPLRLIGRPRKRVDALLERGIERVVSKDQDMNKPRVKCTRCNQNFSGEHLCPTNHKEHCDIRTSRDGWDANCTCKRGRP